MSAFVSSDCEGKATSELTEGVVPTEAVVLGPLVVGVAGGVVVGGGFDSVLANDL